MDYRRRYLRRLANQNKSNTNEEQSNNNKIEEKPAPEKIEEKVNKPNLYLQRLLAKNNNPLNSSLNLSSVNESLPSFTTNIRDILSTEENKQRAIKYVIHKRNEEKYGTKSSVNTENELEEESNPVLSNKYYNYPRNLNISKNIEIRTDNNNTKSDSRYALYYARRSKNNNNIQEDNKSQYNKDENNNKKSRKSSKSNVKNYKEELEVNNNYYSENVKRNYDNQQNNNEDIDNDNTEETNEKNQRYRNYRGYGNKKEDDDAKVF